MSDIKRDRTRAARHIFVAKAVVTEVESEKEIHGVLRNLSLYGCYVETPAPFCRGVMVELAITHSSQKFMVLGKVAHAQPKGMGIVFMSTQPNDQVILEKWMEQLRKP
jgi:hypothetical protein